MRCTRWKSAQGTERPCGSEARCTVTLPGKEPRAYCYDCGRAAVALAHQDRLHVVVDELPVPLEPRAA